MLSLIVVVLGSLTLFLAACGDEEETTGAATTTDVATTTPPEEQEKPAGPNGEATGGGDGAPPAADVEVDESAAFATPTGNIECFIDKLTVRCDIAERSWKPPAPPADCELDYGQGVTLAAGGPAELVCAGDTVIGPNGPELPEGQSISAGLLRCESAESGLTCRDIETGRGFELSAEGYELF
jgi:hypothetical protein